MTKIPAWLDDKPTTVPKEIPAWLDDKPSTVPKVIPAWLDDKPTTVPKEIPAWLDDKPTTVPKAIPAWLDDKPTTVPKAIPAWLEDKLPKRRGRNLESSQKTLPKPLDEKFKEVRYKPLNTMAINAESANITSSIEREENPVLSRINFSEIESICEQACKDDAAQEKCAINKGSQESTSIMRQDEPISAFRDKCVNIISPITRDFDANEKREPIPAEIATVLKDLPLNEGETQTARDYLRNGGNPWMLKKVRDIYWPTDVQIPKCDVDGKNRIDAYAGDIDQIIQELNINVPEASGTLKDFHGKGIVLPIGLWPKAIDYLLKWNERVRMYQLNEGALDLIKSRKFTYFADGDTISLPLKYLKSDSSKPSAESVSNALNLYYRQYGLGISKKGDYFKISCLSLDNFLTYSSSKFVVPIVTDEMLIRMHATEILLKYGNKVTIDDLRMMILYGAEQIGWGPFVGGDSAHMLTGLSGGSGEWQVTRLYLDPTNSGMDGQRLSDIYIHAQEDVEPSFELKKEIFQNGLRGAELDVLDVISERNEAIKMCTAAVARGSKVGTLNGGGRDGIFNNLLNLLSCARTDDEKGANLVKALKRYDFDVTEQGTANWNALAQELMTGRRYNRKNKKSGTIETRVGKYIAVFQISDDISVRIFKKNDGVFLRYEIKRLSDPTPARIEYTVKSEVGIIDESVANCYGSATTEPAWIGTPDTSKWTSPIEMTITQSLKTPPDIGAIACDIEAALGGKRIQHICRSAFEHMDAMSSASVMAKGWMMKKFGVEVSEDVNTHWIGNGKLTTQGLIRMSMKLMQDSIGEVFLTGKFMCRVFKCDNRRVTFYLKDKAHHMAEFDIVTPITLSNGEPFIRASTEKTPETIFTTARPEILDAKLQDAQITVYVLERKAKIYTNIMVGNGLADKLRKARNQDDASIVDDVRWHVGIDGTVKRIVHMFHETAVALKNSALLPAGIIDYLNEVDMLSIEETLGNKLERLSLKDGALLLRKNSRKNEYTIINDKVKQAWLDAWGTLIKGSISYCAKRTGEACVLGDQTFSVYVLNPENPEKPRLISPQSRVDALTKAILKASFIGYWISPKTFATLSDIIFSAPKLKFNAMCIDHYFDILKPGFTLGSDGYYYLRVKWFKTPDKDGIQREYIVSFAANGDINVNGFYVYSSFASDSKPGVAAPNHLYSSIPAKEMDAFMETIRSGKPAPITYSCLHFQPGPPVSGRKVPYWMWDLIDASCRPNGTPIQSDEEIT